MENIESISQSLHTEQTRVKLKILTQLDSYNKKEIAQNLIDSVRKGQIEFISIIIENGHEEEILKIEKRLYDSYMKYKLYSLKVELLQQYRVCINSYINKIVAGDNIEKLSDELYKKLQTILFSTIDEAFLLEKESAKVYKFLFYKVEIEDTLKIGEKMLNQFNEFELKPPFNNLSQRLALINKQLKEITDLNNKYEIDNFTYLTEMNEAHFKLQIYNSGLRMRFIELLNDPDNNLPLAYHFDPMNKAAINKLLTNKYSPYIILDDDTNDTLLHVAIEYNQFEIFELLLDRGAWPDFKNKKGLSALQIATTHKDPRYLNAINKRLQKSSIYDSHLKEIEDVNIRAMLKPFEEAEKILKEYNDLLNKRKNFLSIVRTLLFLESRIELRSSECSEYLRRYRFALNELDPHILLDEIDKKYRKTDRGLLGRSQLHDSLKRFKDEFLDLFDFPAFNELKNNYKMKNGTAKPNQSNINDRLKQQEELIEKLRNELLDLKIKLKREDKPNNEERQTSPKLKLF